MRLTRRELVLGLARRAARDPPATLLVEKEALLESRRKGLLADAAYEPLLADVDARLVRLDEAGVTDRNAPGAETVKDVMAEST